MLKHQLAVKGIRISYIEQNPDCKNIIFFIHGNSISSTTWMKQLSSELLSKYRLIAIDLPAHGDSEASPEPDNDYTFSGLASIATLLVDYQLSECRSRFTIASRRQGSCKCKRNPAGKSPSQPKPELLPAQHHRQWQ